ncbi:MAG: glycosyltransferase family 2 protein, partial [Granulosicoccaceae bacterium]
AEDDPMLVAGAKPQVLAIGTDNFSSHTRDRATGPLQITHGDVARGAGYCECIALYQTPSEVWCKAHEDRAFRWLLQTQGTAIELPGVFRIRHLHKGRYTGNSVSNRWRSFVRQVASRLKGEDKT